MSILTKLAFGSASVAVLVSIAGLVEAQQQPQPLTVTKIQDLGQARSTLDELSHKKCETMGLICSYAPAQAVKLANRWPAMACDTAYSKDGHDGNLFVMAFSTSSAGTPPFYSVGGVDWPLAKGLDFIGQGRSAKQP